MSELDEKLLNRIKDEVARENRFINSWELIDKGDWHSINEAVNEVCRRYAEEVNKELLESKRRQLQCAADRHNEDLEYKNNEISQLKKQLEEAEELNSKYASQFHGMTSKIIRLESKLEVKEKPDFEELAYQKCPRKTKYGDAEAPIGSSARSYFETEINGFIRGLEISFNEYVIPRDAAIAELSHNIDNLIASLHGDGGHYREKHGRIKAIQDAQKLIHEKWVNKDIIAERDEKIKELERLQSESWGLWHRQNEKIKELKNDLETERTTGRQEWERLQLDKVSKLESELNQAKEEITKYLNIAADSKELIYRRIVASCKASLEKAADNAYPSVTGLHVVKESIINESNIVIIE